MWGVFDLLVVGMFVFVPLALVVLGALEIAHSCSRRNRPLVRFSLRTLFIGVTSLCVTFSIARVFGPAYMFLAPFVWMVLELVAFACAEIKGGPSTCRDHILRRRPSRRVRRWWAQTWPNRYAAGRSGKIHEVLSSPRMRDK